MQKEKIETKLYHLDGKDYTLPSIKTEKDLFISYKRENAPYVSRLYDELKEHDIHPWLDINELPNDVGKEYTALIHKVIDESKFFLLIYTKEVEQSDFIINEELGYAVKKNKTILFYPKDSIDISKSKLKEYVSKIQWLDTAASAINQRITQAAIADEKRMAELSAMINEKHGKSVFEDQSLFMIRIALQRLLNKITIFGNYKKLCGTATDDFYGHDNIKLAVHNKAFFIDVPDIYKSWLEELGFFKKDNIEQVEQHIKKLRPDNQEILQRFLSFMENHNDVYSMATVRQRLIEYTNVEIYRDIIIPQEDNFDIEKLMTIVSSMAACTFIRDLEKGKMMFNGAELGVSRIIDERTINSEHPCVEIQLYYSDYFTFKCMTEMYHILCSIDDRPFITEKVQDITPLAPFLCSLGLGGFLAAYCNEDIQLLWTRRSANISSGDIWHFSYDETVSLLLDGTKDPDGNLRIDHDNTVHIDHNLLLLRALKEEVGATPDIVSQEHHGIFEIGIIKSERLEIEIISQAVLHLEKQPSPQEQIKKLHDAANDGYLEISKVEFLPLRNHKPLIGRLLTPEAYEIYKRMQSRLRDNVGKMVKIGTGTTIEPGSFIDDNATIGSNCRIHRNVYIGPNVKIGNNVKIQNNNSIYQGVTLEDGVFVGTNVSFINDRYPRAIHTDGRLMQPRDWTPEPTTVRYGASIGAGAVILCGLTIGKWAMVGAGAVVVDNVPDGMTVAGNPAHIIAPCKK